ncbi:hypothetical protein [Marinospirillum sp.]|uniref:hypothetical protein n=1 Tax=Marinospirillum sp. TaxID=2183934 RepID=UPI00384A8045
MESVAGFAWNGWQLSSGISGRLGLEYASNDTFASEAYWNQINGDVCTQRLAGGGAVVGGAIRPDALVTIGGLEMTVQQAVDTGLRPASMIGHQTGSD